MLLFPFEGLRIRKNLSNTRKALSNEYILKAEETSLTVVNTYPGFPLNVEKDTEMKRARHDEEMSNLTPSCC